MGLQKNLDVMIISASRPKLLPYVVDSIKKYIFFHGNINIYLHEDFVYPDESNKVLKYCKKQNIETFYHKPKKGIGNAIHYMLNNVVKSKYVLMVQDDFEFELPIDTSHIVWVMNKHSHINGVFFNKRRNLNVINGYKYLEERYDNLFLCLSDHWPLFNGIWRTDFVRKRWSVVNSGHTQEAFWNKIVKNNEKKNDHEYLKNNVGGYYYGPLQYPRTIRHLGYTWSVKPKGKWSIRSDGPGGNVEYDLTGQPAKMRAPWLPQEEERPLYLDNKQDQVKKFKKNENRN